MRTIHPDTVLVLSLLPASVRELGATPSDRRRLGSLLEKLADRGIVRVVGERPPERGGRAAHVYDRTVEGDAVVQEAREALRRIERDLGNPPPRQSRRSA